MKADLKTKTDGQRGLARFFAATEAGDALSVSRALEDNPQWAQEWTDGKTALNLAARKGHWDCVEALLPFGDPNAAASVSGLTPLWHAAEQGSLRSVRLLLAVCDPAKKTLAKETALMAAAFRGHADCVAELLRVIDAKAAKRSGRTALMDAAEQGQLDCLLLLLPRSDAWAENRDGETAFQLAVVEMQWECVDALAACMSEKEREMLRAEAPGVPLPRCQALADQEAIKAELAAGRAPSEASGVASGEKKPWSARRV